MNRRSNEVRGFVRFPVTDPDWKNTGEGGMFVRLVVYEKEGVDWKVCCGGYQHIFCDESLLTDDALGRRERNSSEDLQNILEEQEAWDHLLQKHFPNINQRDDQYQYVSRPYLCVLTLGMSGWSGFHEEKGHYWHCEIEDLTEEGKVLYESIKNLYPGCHVELMTWLDT